MTIERYSVTVEQAQPVSPGAAYAELIASAGSPLSIKSITVTAASNIGGSVALAHAYAVGTGAASGIFTGVCHRTIATAPTGPARAQIAWTSSGVTPTGSTVPLRGEVLPVATGEVRMLWDCVTLGNLIVEPGKSLLVVNQGSGINAGALKINFCWEEGRVTST